MNPGLYDLDSASSSCYTPSLMGELYMNFGPLGVFAGFFLFGLILQALQLLAGNLPSSPEAFVFYAATFLLVGMFLTIGEFLGSSMGYLFWAIPLLLLIPSTDEQPMMTTCVECHGF